MYTSINEGIKSKADKGNNAEIPFFSIKYEVTIGIDDAPRLDMEKDGYKRSYTSKVVIGPNNSIYTARALKAE